VIWEFALAALLIELTPGPNMTWLAILSATHGRAAGLAAVAGIALGLAIAGLAAMLGLAAAIAASPALYQALRWAGSLYLLYLAWEAWRGPAAEQQVGDDGVRRYFYQGLTSNALNPKAYVFYAALLPRFIAENMNFEAAFLTLAAVYVGIATAVHGSIAVFAGTSGNVFTDRINRPEIRGLFAVALVATALWFFFSTSAPRT
jgi:threonine/homoserine/homoserine lactone efflux protein